MIVKPPTALTLNPAKNRLTLTFEEKQYQLSAEFLRVHSPSAEVVGHSAAQYVLQIDKESVTITDITAVGNYAVILNFSDQHNTGIYSWQYLQHLCQNQQSLWQGYLEKLKNAGHKHSQIN